MRLKLIINNPKINCRSDGFTLIEVLVGILMATTFVLVSAQAIALSAVFRVRAQRESEALLWIQEKFENDVKSLASQNITATCEATAPNQGFADALADGVIGSNVDFVSTPTVTVVTIYYDDVANPKPIFLNKAHDATLELSFKNDVPFNVMTVSYAVRDPDVPSTNDRDIIASFYTEVIPDAAFNCD